MVSWGEELMGGDEVVINQGTLHKCVTSFSLKYKLYMKHVSYKEKGHHGSYSSR